MVETTSSKIRIDAILNDWFGLSYDRHTNEGTRGRNWWSSTPEIDKEMSDLFLQDLVDLKEGKLDSWQ